MLQRRCIREFPTIAFNHNLWERGCTRSKGLSGSGNGSTDGGSDGEALHDDGLDTIKKGVVMIGNGSCVYVEEAGMYQAFQPFVPDFTRQGSDWLFGWQ